MISIFNNLPTNFHPLIERGYESMISTFYHFLPTYVRPLIVVQVCLLTSVPATSLERMQRRWATTAVCAAWPISVR